MLVETVNEINSVIKEVFEFTQNNDLIREDFNEYLSTVGGKNIPLNKMEKVFLPYIFERTFGEEHTPLLKFFVKEGQPSNTEIAEKMILAKSSIFEIKKILKNGFELFNLVNEKTYTVISLTKMTNFRGIYAGQYIIARLFEYNNEFYIIEISNVLSHSQKTEAMRYAVMKLMQEPDLLYLENPEKENKIKQTIEEMYEKFIKAFNCDIILTDNLNADSIISAFNDDEPIDLSDKISKLEHPKFFHVRELDNNYSNFIENSLGGFSSHSQTYDVAIIFDKKKGLYTIPFYETFTKIFENKDSVENAKDCIEYFMKNNSIPDIVLNRVSEKYPNFTQVINEFMGTDYTYEELLKEYKSEYLENTIYSSATVLYCSESFSQIFDIITTPQKETAEVHKKVGRNEPCPCGSGKKYKLCCGKE